MERDNDDARMNNLDGRPSNLNTGHVHDIRGPKFLGSLKKRRACLEKAPLLLIAKAVCLAPKPLARAAA